MRSQPAHVLLIDDRPEVEASLIACFRKDPLQIAAARDGRSGLDLAMEKKYDLILLDLEMPEIDGFEVLQRLKATPQTRAIPVVMLTGYDTLADRVRSFELGASDFISKPFEPAELRARIRSVLRAQGIKNSLSQAERELANTQRALSTALEAKARMLEVVNESLRAPLAGNQALAGLLLQYGLNERQQDLVQTILVNSESTLSVLEDLLDYAQLQNRQLKLESRLFDLRQSVEDVLDKLGVKAGVKGLDLAYLWGENVPENVIGDPRRLQQVLANLTANAIKCTARGEVVVRIELAESAGGTAAQSGAGTPAASVQLHFSVRDTGVGISPEKLNRLFTPFALERENQNRQLISSGLGLAICHGLTGLMGGSIWAESQVGLGSTFHFAAPFQPGLESDFGAAFPGQSALTGLKLLVLDNHEASRASICQQARLLGLSAEAAASGPEGLELLRQGRGFDFLLADARLPDYGGTALTREIERLGLPGPAAVIRLTYPGQPREASELHEGGAGAVLRKPSLVHSLQEALLQAMQGVCQEVKTLPAAALDDTLATRLPLRVLIVDGDPITQKILQSILRGFGYEPETANLGVEARQKLEADIFGVVFLDHELDDFDAVEVARQLRLRERERSRSQRNARPAILVAMSENSQEEAREHFLAAGMDDFLSKPPTVQTVLDILENWGPLAQAAEIQKPAAISAINESAPVGTGAGAWSPASSLPPAIPAAAAETPPLGMEIPAAGAAPPPARTDSGDQTALPEQTSPPMDIPRLLESANGDWVSVFELANLYLEQTKHRFEQLIAAIATGNTREVEELARSGAGASEACGVTHMIKPLDELRQLAQDGSLNGAEILCAEAIQEYERLRIFLDKQRLLRQ